MSKTTRPGIDDDSAGDQLRIWSLLFVPNGVQAELTLRLQYRCASAQGRLRTDALRKSEGPIEAAYSSQFGQAPSFPKVPASDRFCRMEQTPQRWGCCSAFKTELTFFTCCQNLRIDAKTGIWKLSSEQMPRLEF